MTQNKTHSQLADYANNPEREPSPEEANRLGFEAYYSLSEIGQQEYLDTLSEEDRDEYLNNFADYLFDKDPQNALEGAVTNLFSTVERTQDIAAYEEKESKLQSFRPEGDYFGVTIKTPDGSYVAIDRLDENEDSGNKMRTVITFETESGTFMDTPYTMSKQFNQTPDGKWHVFTVVALENGKDSPFGVDTITEEMPIEMDDLKTLNQILNRPSKVLPAQRRLGSHTGNQASASLSSRAA